MSETIRTNIPAMVTEFAIRPWVKVEPTVVEINGVPISPNCGSQWLRLESLTKTLGRSPEIGDKGFLSYMLGSSSGLWVFHLEPCHIDLKNVPQVSRIH